MLLTIVTPDTQAGMRKMLERELEGIDHEIINKKWDKGIELAKGNFVCLLETNSAVKRGSIRDNLQVFLDNPSYRKLAMVSPAVDLADNDAIVPFMMGWMSDTTYNGVTYTMASAANGIKSVRLGFTPGAVIRRSSLLKSGVEYKKNPFLYSLEMSIAFWEQGLRVSGNPESLYYAPENITYTKIKDTPEVPSAVLEMWKHEMIS
jgi:hypothetical protein